VAVPAGVPRDIAGELHRRSPAGGGPHIGVDHRVVDVAGQGKCSRVEVQIHDGAVTEVPRPGHPDVVHVERSKSLTVCAPRRVNGCASHSSPPGISSSLYEIPTLGNRAIPIASTPRAWAS
jgi:hypothetical protein